MQSLDRRATLLGAERGRASASWAGITSENAGTILRQYNDGDPALFDGVSGPLSGEWAGDPTPNSLMVELTTRPGRLSPERVDELCSIYETAWDTAYWDEIVRQCYYHLAD